MNVHKRTKARECELCSDISQHSRASNTLSLPQPSLKHLLTNYSTKKSLCDACKTENVYVKLPIPHSPCSYSVGLIQMLSKTKQKLHMCCTFQSLSLTPIDIKCLQVRHLLPHLGTYPFLRFDVRVKTTHHRITKAQPFYC